VGVVPVVINNQDTSLFLPRRLRHTEVSCVGVPAAVSGRIGGGFPHGETP
jgi:hypothetical protein